jgi:hypothetical protein
VLRKGRKKERKKERKGRGEVECFHTIPLPFVP